MSGGMERMTQGLDTVPPPPRPVVAPVKAHEHLDAVRTIIAARGEERDLPDGERSMARAVNIFNACTGVKLSEADGWLFMQCLKLSRQRAGKFKLDDYHDLIGYAALQTECVSASHAKEISSGDVQRASGK